MGSPFWCQRSQVPGELKIPKVKRMRLANKLLSSNDPLAKIRSGRIRPSFLAQGFFALGQDTDYIQPGTTSQTRKVTCLRHDPLTLLNLMHRQRAYQPLGERLPNNVPTTSKGRCPQFSNEPQTSCDVMVNLTCTSFYRCASRYPNDQCRRLSVRHASAHNG